MCFQAETEQIFPPNADRYYICVRSEIINDFFFFIMWSDRFPIFNNMCIEMLNENFPWSTKV